MTNNNKAPSSPSTLTPSSSSSGVPMNDENIFKQNVAAARGVHGGVDNLDSIVVLSPKQCNDPSIEAAAAVTHRNLVSAAKQRIIAPLTRANLKRCRKNFAKLDLNAEYQSKACLLGASTSTTTTNSETTSLFGSGVEGGGGLNEQLSLLSTNPSKLTTTKSPTTKQKRFKKFLAEKQQHNTEDAQQQPQQQQTIIDSSKRSSSLSGRRTRTRRLQFFKRSTSRFSSKSSPG